jgi:cellulose biosynthesis protein BcsQ
MEFKNGEYIIQAEFQEFIKGFPFDKKDINYHGKFKINIKQKETGYEYSFDFYGSAIDAQKHITEMDDQELKNALECIISDAIAGSDSFENFCSNFGYDKDSRTAERIYNACKESLSKMDCLGFTLDDLYNLSDELNQ